MRGHPAYVYLLLDQLPSCGLIKIGASGNPAGRAKSQKGIFGARPTLIAMFPSRHRVCAQIVENRAHTILEKYRVAGEWFLITPKQAMIALSIAFDDTNHFASDCGSNVECLAIRAGQQRRRLGNQSREQTLADRERLAREMLAKVTEYVELTHGPVASA